MFPAPDQLGIDLVLPGLRLPARARRGHRGDRAHPRARGPRGGAALRAARARRRTPPDLRRPAHRRDGALEARRAQAQGRARSRTCWPGEQFEAGPFELEMVKMAHSIPDMFAVALTCDLGTTLITGDYKFDQTPVDGMPADVARLAELGRDGVLLLCGDSHQRRPARAWSLSESSVGPHLEETFARCDGPHRGHLLRLEHPPRAAGGGRRRRAGPQGRAGGPLDAQEREHRAARWGTSTCPTACSWSPSEIEDFPDHKLVVISTGSQGEPLSALRRMAGRRPPPRGAARGRHGDLLGHADPGQRAGGERDHRPDLPAGRRT